MTTGTSATAQDKSGDTWKMNVDKDNCWEDLILTLGTYVRATFRDTSLARAMGEE